MLVYQRVCTKVGSTNFTIYDGMCRGNIVGYPQNMLNGNFPNYHYTQWPQVPKLEVPRHIKQYLLGTFPQYYLT